MHILLVEDEVRLARSYQRNLQDEGHVVEVAHDAETAQARVLRDPDSLDVLVLDVLLPGRNGIELCRDLRRDGVILPILLLTALDTVEEKVMGLDAGADDYLTKPFPLDELLARLRALVRRRQRFESAAVAGQIHVGDLVMDIPRHMVTRGGVINPLTAREFELLEYLARNAGRVLTRAQLTQQLWPDGTDAGSNVLESYIHYLRDKLDRDPDEKLIHTVRGVGYSLRPAKAGSS
jgi:two-component system, OmpR family, copper resistance phosphate regulon response regulator CusR